MQLAARNWTILDESKMFSSRREFLNRGVRLDRFPSLAGIEEGMEGGAASSNGKKRFTAKFIS